MEAISCRDLTVEEVKCLRRWAPSPLLALKGPIFSGAFFFAVLAAPMFWLSKYFDIVKTLLPVYLVAVGLRVGYQMIDFFRSELKRSSELRMDLETGKGEVRTYRAVDAIRVEEFEDEGTGVFLKLEDGRILFVFGQHFYELEEKKQFPCREFQIEQTPNAKWFLEFKCTGSYFPPSYSRSPFNKQDIKRGRVPCDGDIFEGDFELLKVSNGSFSPGAQRRRAAHPQR